MKFNKPLEAGVFRKRYKRFFADIEVNGKVEVAHVANTGSLKSCLFEGAECLFSRSEDPGRKLKLSLEMLKVPSGEWVGINTAAPNKIVREALEKGLLPHWRGFGHIQNEVKINSQTRLDFCLQNSQPTKKHFIEVKNVTMREGDSVQFPDAKTERGQKHLLELMELMDQGHSAEILFVVQRADAQKFRPADAIDPEYGRLLRQAHSRGLRITALLAELSASEISLSGKSLPVDLG